MALTRIRAQQISNIDYKQAVRVVTTSNISLSGGAPSSVDGVALSVNSRILVNGQGTQTQNGLYLVQTVGTGSNGTWVRTNDTDVTGEMQAGMVVTVTEGDVYRDTLWTLTTNDPIVIGSSNITFQQSTSFNFGNITANGTAILANTVGDGITFTAGNNIAITGNATAKTVTIGVTGIQSTEISNGTSNVSIGSANANVTVGVNGTGNVAVFAASGVTVAGTIEASGNIAGAYFIGNGSQLTGLPEQYGNANVAAYLPTYTGSIGAGNITATGNVSANYFLGNGSQLSGIITSVANINNGTSNVSIDAANANVTVGVNGTGNIAVFAASGVTVTGNILPAANTTYSLGSTSQRWKDLWVANSTIYLGETPLTTTGNTLLVNGLSVITGANANTISLSGNITGGNLSGSLITGTLTTAAQPNITSVGTLSNVTVTANVTGGNLSTGGLISATGNITGGNITTAGVVRATGDLFGKELWSTQSSGDEGGQVNLGIPATNTSLTGQVTIDVYQNRLRFFQGNNAKGAYIDLTAAADGVGTNLLAGGGGGIEWTTSATAPVGPNPGDFWYDTDDDKTYQYVNDGVGNAWVDQSAPTSFGNLTVGNILNGGANGSGNIGSATGYFNTTFSTNGTFVNLSGNGAALTAINASNISSGTLGQARLANAAVTLGSTALTLGATVTTVAGLSSVTSTTFVGALTGAATTAGTVTTAAQPNITSTGTLSSLTMGGLLTGYSSTNTDVNTANDGGSFSARGNASTIASMTFHRTGAYAINMGLGTDNVFRIGGWSASANCMQLSGAGAMTILSSLTLNSAGGATAIVNGGSNGVGNIGSSTTYFNTVFAKATSAQYADLAENYLADCCYEPGTVVIFGGNAEVSVSSVSHDPRVAGVVSTNPSYLMNATLIGPTVAAVALTGRVPCWVQGPVAKGDRIVNAGTGIGGRLDRLAYEPGCIVGKSLEDITDDSTQLIEVVIGRF